jgi:hypothetical protein
MAALDDGDDDGDGARGGRTRRSAAAAGERERERESVSREGGEDAGGGRQGLGLSGLLGVLF